MVKKKIDPGIPHKELTPFVCQCPLNDASPWRFCGGEKMRGSSYCRVHAKLCHSGKYQLGTRPPRPASVARFSEEKAA